MFQIQHGHYTKELMRKMVLNGKIISFMIKSKDLTFKEYFEIRLKQTINQLLFSTFMQIIQSDVILLMSKGNKFWKLWNRKNFFSAFDRQESTWNEKKKKELEKNSQKPEFLMQEFCEVSINSYHMNSIGNTHLFYPAIIEEKSIFKIRVA